MDHMDSKSMKPGETPGHLAMNKGRGHFMLPTNFNCCSIETNRVKETGIRREGEEDVG